MPDPLSRLLRTLAAPSADDVSDAELLARGDAASLELVIRRHAGMVWRVCLTVTREPHAAEDAFQATFLALARKPSAVRDRSAVGWLHRVAYRLAQRARPAFTPNEYPEPETREFGPVERAEQAEMAEVVLDTVSRLPDRYRVPVVLCHLEGFTQAEAATQLGLPLGTVGIRVKRGLERLKGMLARTGAVAATVLLATFSGVAFAAPPRVVFRATELASGAVAPSTAVVGLMRSVFAGGVSLKLMGVVTALAVAASGIVWGVLPAARQEVRPLPVVAEVARLPAKVAPVAFRAFPVTTDLQRLLLGDPSAGTCVCLDPTISEWSGEEWEQLRITLRAESFPKVKGLVFVRRAPTANDTLHHVAKDAGFAAVRVVQAELLAPEKWEQARRQSPAKDESATFLGAVAVYPVDSPLSRILTGGADAVLAQAGPRGGDDLPPAASVRHLVDSLGLHTKGKLAVLQPQRPPRRPGDDHDHEHESERKKRPTGRGLDALAASLGFDTVVALPAPRAEPPHEHEHPHEHGGRPPKK